MHKPILTAEKKFRALCGILATGAKSKGLEQSLRHVTSEVSKHTGFPLVCIERYIPESLILERIGYHGMLGGKNLAPARVAVADTPSGFAVRTGKLRLLENGGPFRGVQTKSLIMIPLSVDGGIIGVMTLGSPRKRDVDKQFLGFLRTLASEVAWLVERKQADDALMASEQKYRQLFMGAHDTVMIEDSSSGVIIDANPQAYFLTGYSQEELVGKHVSFLRPAEETAGHRAESRTSSEADPMDSPVITHIRNKNGKQVPVVVNERKVRVGGRGVIVSILRDMTEQKKAEVKLTASEELLRIIVEGTMDTFFFVHDTHGVFTYLSPSVKRITGHDVQDWKDTYTKFLTENPLNNQMRIRTKQICEDGTTGPAYLCEIRHADHRPVLLEIDERPILREGKIIGVQGMARDITEKKRLEDAILESRDHLNRILSQTPLVVHVFDADGNTVDVNEAWLRMFGLSGKQDIIGKLNVLRSVVVQKLLLKDQVEAAFRGEVVDIPQVTLDRGLTEPGVGLSMPDRTLHMKMFPVFDRNANLVNVVAMMEDISERKQLEEQLIQSQKMESIGLLAGGIAHDFNNILSGILGYASLLKTQVPDDGKVFAEVDTIERSALRAAELTSQLLAFARGGKYVVAPVEINGLIDETVTLLRGSLENNIRVEKQLAVDLPVIEADASQMQQVLMNLCINARDAMPRGGVLRLITEHLTDADGFLLSQQEVRRSGYIRITIADSGVGIDKAIQGRIFEPFFTTKGKGKGTGLGLAMVYGIVKNHGGFINVQSEVGKGTAFIVYVPATETHISQTGIRSEQVIGGNEVILIVDDEETIRSLVKDILESMGYTVIGAADGREAVALYKERGSTIDLVVLDMAMPGMAGPETFERLMAMNPALKAILSTGYAEDERARNLIGKGVKAFVQKPFRIDELAGAVRKVLDGTTIG